MILANINLWRPYKQTIVFVFAQVMPSIRPQAWYRLKGLQDFAAQSGSCT